MVTLPPHLLCEVPAEEVPRRPAAATASPQAIRPSTVTDLTRGEPTRPQQWEPPELPGREQPGPTGDLPRRERASLRGDEPRPQPREQPPPPTPEQLGAARRAFAEELSAFTQGASLDAAAADDDIAIEEDAKP
jgi:hypothetical protein